MRFPLPSRAFETPYWAAAPVTDPRKKTTAINFMLSLSFNRPYSTIAASRTPTMPKLGVADLFRTSSLHKLAKQARWFKRSYGHAKSPANAADAMRLSGGHRVRRAPHRVCRVSRQTGDLTYFSRDTHNPPPLRKSTNSAIDLSMAQ